MLRCFRGHLGLLQLLLSALKLFACNKLAQLMANSLWGMGEIIREGPCSIGTNDSEAVLGYCLINQIVKGSIIKGDIKRKQCSFNANGNKL